MGTSRSVRLASFLVAALMASSAVFAQQSSAAPAAPVNSGSGGSSVVPHLVNYSGVLKDSTGRAVNAVAGVTFLLYTDQQGGSPVWMETQNVTPDKSGHYTVQLGATRGEGLPASVFLTGEARWLGVQESGQAEQPRVLLVAVPYAMKAADAETVGGLPPSAFVLAAPIVESVSPPSAAQVAGSSVAPPTASNVTTSGGTVNTLPLWTTTTNIQSSAVTQTGTGPTAKIGIGTTIPASTLDVKGSTTLRGAVTLPAIGAATATVGKSSQPQNLVASSFSSSTSTAINQTFKWQAEPAANNTANPSGTLNLLYGSGASLAAETGLLISSKGVLRFAPGQTFPGVGTGTVKSVRLTAPASDFVVTGSPVTTTGTLGLNWKVAPTSASTANAIVKRDASGGIFVNDLTGTGTFSTETANAYGAYATSAHSSGTAIFGAATSATGFTVGIRGVTNSASGGTTGVFGLAANADPLAGSSQGVTGQSNSSRGIGVLGVTSTLSETLNRDIGSGGATGVWGDSPNAIGVLATSDAGLALVAENNSDNAGTVALHQYGLGLLLTASGPIGLGCRMDGAGNMSCTGVLTGSAKNFKIDHPVNPANQYLVHASVESPDMKTVYDGVVVLEANGEAWVQLPAYFEALNGDFRYQLTCMGAFAPVYIAQEISNNQFRIAGGKSGMKVSWQVTGIRHDAYAKAHPLVVEAEKQGDERGHYLHPEDFGQPNQLSIGVVRRDKMLPHAAGKFGSSPVPK